jgi:hypothetical protein
VSRRGSVPKKMSECHWLGEGKVLVKVFYCVAIVGTDLHREDCGEQEAEKCWNRSRQQHRGCLRFPIGAVISNRNTSALDTYYFLAHLILSIYNATSSLLAMYFLLRIALRRSGVLEKLSPRSIEARTRPAWSTSTIDTILHILRCQGIAYLCLYPQWHATQKFPISMCEQVWIARCH